MWFYLFHKYLNLDLKDLLMYNHSFDASFLGASSFKERKKIENRKVVELGGKVISFSLRLGILAGNFFIICVFMLSVIGH